MFCNKIVVKLQPENCPGIRRTLAPETTEEDWRRVAITKAGTKCRSVVKVDQQHLLVGILFTFFHNNHHPLLEGTISNYATHNVTFLHTTHTFFTGKCKQRIDSKRNNN